MQYIITNLGKQAGALQRKIKAILHCLRYKLLQHISYL